MHPTTPDTYSDENRAAMGLPPMPTLRLTPTLAGYLLALVEVDNGENAPDGLDLDALTDQLAAVARKGA